ncbi:MAG: fibronectin type III domain-containing protein [Bacteroidales bacterium]|nr:fibronectin type III domain-containing protein [Bacteroidales bacterium]
MPENNNNCPSCLEDLMRPSACEKTLGGMVTEFLYGYKDDVQTWPQKQSAALRTGLVDHVETVSGSNLVMKTGKRMFRVQVKKGSAELKYELQGESGAKSFKSTLECNIPGFRSAILGFMSATANQELVILAKTRSGEWHLLGDDDEGVEYDSGTANSGKTGTDANGADVTFATECAAPTVYQGDVDSLKTVDGTAATIVMGTEVVSGTGVTLKATATANDSTITKVGFRYKVEGTADWTTANVSSFTSGTEFSKSVTGLTASTDYLYYAYMVVDGHEVYTETYTFTTGA